MNQDDPKWKRDYEQGRLVMPHEGAVSYANARAEPRAMPAEVTHLRALVAELEKTIKSEGKVHDGVRAAWGIALDKAREATARVAELETKVGEYLLARTGGASIKYEEALRRLKGVVSSPSVCAEPADSGKVDSDLAWCLRRAELPGCPGEARDAIRWLVNHLGANRILLRDARRVGVDLQRCVDPARDKAPGPIGPHPDSVVHDRGECSACGAVPRDPVTRLCSTCADEREERLRPSEALPTLDELRIDNVRLRKERDAFAASWNSKEADRRRHRDGLQAWADAYAVEYRGVHPTVRDQTLWEFCTQELTMRVPLVPNPPTNEAKPCRHFYYDPTTQRCVDCNALTGPRAAEMQPANEALPLVVGDYVRAWKREPDGDLAIGRIVDPGDGPTSLVDWRSGPHRMTRAWFPKNALRVIEDGSRPETASVDCSCRCDACQYCKRQPAEGLV